MGLGATSRGHLRGSKKALAPAEILELFDSNKTRELVRDASPYGLSAVLAQREASEKSSQLPLRPKAWSELSETTALLDKEPWKLCSEEHILNSTFGGGHSKTQPITNNFWGFSRQISELQSLVHLEFFVETVPVGL